MHACTVLLYLPVYKVYHAWHSSPKVRSRSESLFQLFDRRRYSAFCVYNQQDGSDTLSDTQCPFTDGTYSYKVFT